MIGRSNISLCIKKSHLSINLSILYLFLYYSTIIFLIVIEKKIYAIIYIYIVSISPIL